MTCFDTGFVFALAGSALFGGMTGSALIFAFVKTPKQRFLDAMNKAAMNIDNALKHSHPHPDSQETSCRKITSTYEKADKITYGDFEKIRGQCGTTNDFMFHTVVF